MRSMVTFLMSVMFLSFLVTFETFLSVMVFMASVTPMSTFKKTLKMSTKD